MKVALREGRTPNILYDSKTRFQTSYLTIGQQWWKKLEVKPSGPGIYQRAYLGQPLPLILG
jgi:hypothetical protein